MSKKQILDKILVNRQKIRSFGVKTLGIFGSYVRGVQSKDSDVDVLVKFDRKTFDNYMDLKFFLEDTLKTKVDLVLLDTLKPQLKSQILDEVDYVKGL